MPNLFAKKHSLSRDCLLFSLITFVVLFAVAVITVIAVREDYIKNNQQILIKQTSQISNVIDESFAYINHINSFIGRQIADHGAVDLHFIHDLFTKESDSTRKNSEIFSWSFFDWVDDQGFQAVNSKVGIRKDPPDMNTRNYTKTAPQNPWMLQVSKPAIGIPSNEWVIPVGTGVVNNKGKYLGIVAVGVNVNRLTNKISHQLSNDNSSFVVLDKNLNIVVQSADNNISADKNLGDIIKSDLFEQNSGFLEKTIRINNIIYSFYQKMENYPYIILSGFNENFINQQFSLLILPRILELIVITFFFIGLLYFFRKQIVAPITKLSDAAFNISKGNINVTIPHFKAKEADNLAKALLYVKQFFKKEKEMKEKIYQANLDKTEFLGHVSHELRNTLSGVIGLSDIILNKYKNEKLGQKEQENKEFLELINSSSNDGLQFLADLVDITKSENGNSTLNKKPNIDLKEIINSAVKLSKVAAMKAQITVNTAIDKNLPTITCDRQRMKQIMLNLISNSIKYSRKNTTITISARQQKEQIIISVKDQGLGMDEEEIKIALTKYGTIKNENSDQVDSFGLGLPLVKYLVELHGAKFEIFSKKNQGTEVVITFDNIGKVKN